MATAQVVINHKLCDWNKLKRAITTATFTVDESAEPIEGHDLLRNKDERLNILS